jgi:hypothetical protein
VQLQSAEFLYETNLFPELEHTFKHALTHEVAYGTLLGDRRRTPCADRRGDRAALCRSLSEQVEAARPSRCER